MRTARILGALAALAGLSAQTSPPRYAEGQVWEYRTRAEDEGSLLKIQRIETGPTGSKADPIYHISVIGIRLRNPSITPQVPHAPISRATLDASVTKLTESSVPFPDAEPGIAEWRKARGGIFTIGVADIVDLVDMQTSGIGQ